MARIDGKINAVKGIRISETLKSMEVDEVCEISNSKVSKECMRATCSRFKNRYGKVFVVNTIDATRYSVTRIS